MTKPRVFVTGATGIVGSHIAQHFVEAGYLVRCGQRNASSSRWLEHLEVETLIIDLADPEVLRAALQDVDIVVHAAGVTSAPTEATFRAVNTTGTVRLAEAARCAGVRRFVHISSLAARGPSRTQAAGQDRPISAYGRSKLEAETKLRDFAGKLEVVALRPVTVYGPRDHYLVPLYKMASAGFIVTPMGEGAVQFVHVSDLAAATLAAATAPARFGPFPIAEDAILTWSELAAAFGAAFGRVVRRLPLPAGLVTGAGWVSEMTARLRGVEADFDVRRARDIAMHSWTCNPERAELELGWRAGVPLVEGMTRTAEWYREHGWL